MSEFTAGWWGRVAWSEESRSGFWDSPSSGEACLASAASNTMADEGFRFNLDGSSITGDAFRLVPEVFLAAAFRTGDVGVGDIAAAAELVEFDLVVGLVSAAPLAAARLRGIVEKRGGLRMTAPTIRKKGKRIHCLEKIFWYRGIARNDLRNL